MDTPTSQQARDDDVPTPVFRLVAVACRPGRPRSDPRRAAGAEVRRRPGHGDRARPPVREYSSSSPSASSAGRRSRCPAS